MIKTKQIYEAREPGDGFRLLVMRKWPRGVSKTDVDAWEKELGPSLQLLVEWHGGSLSWEQFQERYIVELQGREKLVNSLADRAQGKTVTLLCSCRDEGHCHRTLLKRFVEEAGQGLPGKV